VEKAFDAARRTTDTSKRQRLASAVDPDSVFVDGRSSEELRACVARLAQHIQYYDVGNERAGNWQPFFRDQSAAAPQRALLDAFLIESACREDSHRGVRLSPCSQ